MKSGIPCLCFLLSFSLHAQKVDYVKVRDNLVTFTCGQSIDSSDVYGTIRRLEAFDTTMVRKNLQDYYEDLASAYWLASGGADNDYLRKAIRTQYGALYHKPHNTKSLWGLAMLYSRIQECEKMLYYLGLYKKYLPKRYWGEEDSIQEGYLLAGCN